VTTISSISQIVGLQYLVYKKLRVCRQRVDFLSTNS